MSATSRSLLARLRGASNHDAWAEFQQLYAPLIRGWLVRRGVHDQDAEEVMQEVMQTLLTELPSFEHNGRVGALRCWLRRVVANCLKKFWRRENRQPRALGGDDYADLAAGLEDPHSQLSRLWNDEYNRVVCDRLLDRVKTDFHEQTMLAFRGVAIDGKHAAEVAEQTGLTVNAVRIAQSRVMRRLREVGVGLLD